jgi:oxalate decarboxylase/phosphoglucose isomerase-like protein (cupin superfamily)
MAISERRREMKRRRQRREKRLKGRLKLAGTTGNPGAAAGKEAVKEKGRSEKKAGK